MKTLTISNLKQQPLSWWFKSVIERNRRQAKQQKPIMTIKLMSNQSPVSLLTGLTGGEK